MIEPQRELFEEIRPWGEVALEAVYVLAQLRPSFTTDDVWAALATRDGTRALGSVMIRAKANGWIADSGEVRRSVRPECHTRRLAVWRSLLVPSNVASMQVTVRLAHADAAWIRALVATANADRGALILQTLDAVLGG